MRSAKGKGIVECVRRAEIINAITGLLEKHALSSIMQVIVDISDAKQQEDNDVTIKPIVAHLMTARDAISVWELDQMEEPRDKSVKRVRPMSH